MTPPGLGVALQAAPAGALAVWRTAAAQHQGARGHQCDAVAVDADGNRAAAVVVDGVGDDDQIAGIGPDVAEDLAARARSVWNPRPPSPRWVTNGLAKSPTPHTTRRSSSRCGRTA
ncbi:hypothetical protein ACU686_26510 [Yinghuangia aomiensis]